MHCQSLMCTCLWFAHKTTDEEYYYWCGLQYNTEIEDDVTQRDFLKFRFTAQIN